jgi:hypothetical protein
MVVRISFFVVLSRLLSVFGHGQSKDRWLATSSPGGTSVYALTHIGRTLYAGASANGVFVSSDNGLTWRAINSGLTSFDFNVLAAKGLNALCRHW